MVNELPLIYLITDGSITSVNFERHSKNLLELVRAAVEAKVSIIQIREKQLSARELFELTLGAAKITRGSQTKLLINDRADVAFAANADGVHLTANSLSATTIRQSFSPDFIIGVSAHSLAEVERAQNENASFATFSPIFHTPAKAQYGAAQGVQTLREVCSKIENFPIVALGGIDETNFAETLTAGASGVAAIRLLQNSQELPKIVKKIKGV